MEKPLVAMVANGSQWRNVGRLWHANGTIGKTPNPRSAGMLFTPADFPIFGALMTPSTTLVRKITEITTSFCIQTVYASVSLTSE